MKRDANSKRWNEGSAGEVPGAFRRLELAVGTDGLKALGNARVAVIGLGAVGSFAVEALARSGVGYLRLVDFDIIQASNINRQIFALSSTVGMPKAEVAMARVKDIFPGCRVDTRLEFFCEETASSILDTPDDEPLDFVIDAIDSLLSKVNLIVACRTRGIPIITSMGAADRMDQSAVHVTDISESQNCPLAKHVRKRLHRRQIYEGVTAVWSSEGPCSEHDSTNEPGEADEEPQRGRQRRTLPSMAPIPGIFGLSAANWVIRGILEKGKVE